jgi:hypothetical protein
MLRNFRPRADRLAITAPGTNQVAAGRATIGWSFTSCYFRGTLQASPFVISKNGIQFLCNRFHFR